MIARCTNPNDPSYRNYGGRGIHVYPEWLDDYAAFLEHVGRRPTPRHSLDRINNEGHYEPGNLRWATLRQQARNRRSNRLVKIGDELVTMVEAAERLGVPYPRFKYLIARALRSETPGATCVA
jgi:hypothetical protein